MEEEQQEPEIQQQQPTLSILAHGLAEIAALPKNILHYLNVADTVSDTDADRLSNTYESYMEQYQVNRSIMEIKTSANFAINVHPYHFNYPGWYRCIGVKCTSNKLDDALSSDIIQGSGSDNNAEYSVTYQQDELECDKTYAHINNLKCMSLDSETRIKKTEIYNEGILLGNVLVKRTINVELPFIAVFPPIAMLSRYNLKLFDELQFSWYISTPIFEDVYFRLVVCQDALCRPTKHDKARLTVEVEHLEDMLHPINNPNCAEVQLYMQAFAFASQTLAHYYALYFSVLEIVQENVEKMNATNVQKLFLLSCCLDK